MTNTMVAGALAPIWFFPNPQPPLPAPAGNQQISFQSVLLVQIKIWNPVTGATHTVTMAVVTPDANPVDHYATYTTLATDFPVPGTYLIQFVMIYSSSNIIETPVQKFTVGQSL